MPRISEFYGIAIYMYWGDHDPPHFHALYAGHEALVAMDASVIAGGLPPRAMRMVGQWARLHRDELMANWARALSQEPLMPIRGLE